MFTTNHFIWLAIAIMIIVGYQLINKFLKLSLDKNITFLFAICILSEIVKTAVNIERGTGDELGFYLDVSDLPFHLCSMQLFFVTAIKFFVKKEETIHTILCFMFPTMLLGGTIALFIPTVGVSFSNVQVYQYFIFHSVIVSFSIYLILNKVIKLTFKSMITTIEILAMLVFAAMWINSALNEYDANFFYLARPPMDNLPILNLNNGWFAYFFTLLAIALVLMTALQLPIVLYNRNKDKENNVNKQP